MTRGRQGNVRRVFGLPWRDLLRKLCYPYDTSEVEAIELGVCMPGLGQGSGPGISDLIPGLYRANLSDLTKLETILVLP